MDVINDDKILMEDVIHYSMSRRWDTTIELVVRPECNQKCEYCYLYQNGKELYPIRANATTILQNCKMLIDYFIEKDYIIKRIDLFAGDLFFDNLFFDLMPILKKYYSWLYTQHKEVIDYFNNISDKADPCIIIPCNMSFCESDDKIDKVKQIINSFKELGIKVYFSYSTDGRYATDIREKKYVPDEFFDKVFKFCEEEDWGVHPMISYESIDHIYDNYEWFKKKLSQFNLNNGSPLPYFLEVRNDGWSAESLEKYKSFLKYYLNDIFHNFSHSNLSEFFEGWLRIFKKHPDLNSYQLIGGQSGIGKLLLVPNHMLPCSLGMMNLTVSLGDLSLLPCHRLAYPELRGGTFEIKENKITGFSPSPYYNSFLNIFLYNNDFKPKCVTCDYKMFCMKGCAGAQYEKFGDINYPIPSVCELLKTKVHTVMEYYHSIGLFHWLFTTEPEYPSNGPFKDLLIKMGYTEYQKYDNLGEFNNNEYRIYRTNNVQFIPVGL